MPRKNEVVKTGGACWASAFIRCPNDETSPCWKCGWNPNAKSLAARRVETAVREYRRKLDAGEIRPSW